MYNILFDLIIYLILVSHNKHTYLLIVVKTDIIGRFSQNGHD